MNACIDDVGVHAGAVTGWIEPAVERQRALIDPVEMPRHTAGRRCRYDRDDEDARGDEPH